MSDSELSLAEVMRDLRLELEEAERQADGATLRFGVDKVEVELSVEITKEKEYGGKVRFKVVTPLVEIGAEGGASRTATTTLAHKIRLELHLAREGDDTKRLLINSSKAERKFEDQ
jgi:hypothetical protein